MDVLYFLGCMNGGMAHKAFQSGGNGEQLVDLFVFLTKGVESRFLAESLGQGNVDGRRHQFGNAVFTDSVNLKAAITIGFAFGL